ncbi:MAG: hypothetical protein BGO48_07020 [Mucilaginibacter sp. 44-25]|nr:MAG: hypothetical protein BGO48_07020 [Mucilaginibacter sp. 44-25]
MIIYPLLSFRKGCNGGNITSLDIFSGDLIQKMISNRAIQITEPIAGLRQASQFGILTLIIDLNLKRKSSNNLRK